MGGSGCGGGGGGGCCGGGGGALKNGTQRVVFEQEASASQILPTPMRIGEGGFIHLVKIPSALRIEGLLAGHVYVLR